MGPRVLVLLVLMVPTAADERGPQLDAAAAVVSRLEAAAMAGDRDSILGLGVAGITPASLEELADALTDPRPTRVVLKERDRTAINDGGQRLLLEIFAEYGVEGRLGTWSIDVRRRDGASDDWAITDLDRLSVVTGLYRLALNTERAYDVHNLAVRSVDLTVQMASGRAYVADTPDGTTAVVLLGRGQMHFSPPDPAERTQIRLFSGHESLTADFDAAFLRVRPSEFEERFPPASLRPRTVDERELRRASEVFDEYVGRTLQIDLADLSRDEWSLVPNPTDLIAEIRTKKHGSLTYTRSHNDAEDVALFDRRRRRNISVYASPEKLAERGRYYSEDERVDYDVLSYDIEIDVSPDRTWFVGNARIRLKVVAPAVSSLTVRLADSLNVRSVYASQFGRLLHLRVVNQNSVIVNLPAAVLRDTEMWIQFVYSGRLQPQALDREALFVGGRQEVIEIPPEPKYIYSNRSYWYPQSTVTDYALASLRIAVPAEYGVIASGNPVGPPAPPAGVIEPGQRPRRVFVFEATKPVRYLGFVVSRFSRVDSTRLTFADPLAPVHHAQDGQEPGDGTAPGAVTLYTQANPRQVGRARALNEKAAAVFRFYTSVIGDAPYPSFTLAVTEDERPGGHSPGYFVVLNQTMPGSGLQWRSDPVSFENYPTFFLAHEIAHQWWGQAIGWKNYHEQWISEGFSQYFAALYAEKERSEDSLANLLRQMRHTAAEASSQGPVYLGYRLGHIKGDDRVFRAIIYNKSAMVLHMLRRLVGDDAFFGAVRDFYRQWKYQKAGTDDFRRVMERRSGRDLTRFFETWIHGTSVPRVKFSYRVEGADLAVRFESAEAVDVPITVTIVYASGPAEDVVVTLSDRITERTLTAKGPVRTIEVNGDNAALVAIDK